ncbi:MAG: transcription antitermination factor NusB [Candidatus Omnitrophica bacterium]|nr:transcription antitermination factor NusB [Candidatus Omnitrophota bacterium]
MRKRTQAREFALQLLYQLDITNDPCDSALDAFWQAQEEEGVEDGVKEFTNELVKGVTEHVAQIDVKIAQFAANWQIKRMAVVDRNVIRLGCFELLYRSDIPPKVSINEAVELAKIYSGIEAGKFVNAILDKVKEEARR